MSSENNQGDINITNIPARRTFNRRRKVDPFSGEVFVPTYHPDKDEDDEDTVQGDEGDEDTAGEGDEEADGEGATDGCPSL